MSRDALQLVKGEYLEGGTGSFLSGGGDPFGSVSNQDPSPACRDDVDRPSFPQKHHSASY